MERLLARLERRLGRFAIPNLITLIVGGMAVVWVLTLAKPGFEGLLTLDFDEVKRGQVWRLLTFLFVPPQRSSPFWLLIHLYFTWWVGSTLEQNWGAFKFNAYYFIGALLTIVGAVLAGPSTNIWLDASLFLAFATIFPDLSVLLLVFPVRAKWLAALSAAFMAYAGYVGSWEVRAAILAAVANYLLFFSDHWVAFFRQRGLLAHQKARREAMRGGFPGPIPGRAPSGGDKGGDRGKASEPVNVFGQRTCAICGAREADGADIRVCSCEKCGSVQRTLCLEHARSH